MFNLRSEAPQSSRVCIKYGDGVHSFRLAQGTTLGELAVRVESLAALHDGAPVTIDVVLETSDRCVLSMISHTITTH